MICITENEASVGIEREEKDHRSPHVLMDRRSDGGDRGRLGRTPDCRRRKKGAVRNGGSMVWMPGSGSRRRSAERRETHPVQPAVTLLPLHAAPSAGGGALPPCRAVETTN